MRFTRGLAPVLVVGLTFAGIDRIDAQQSERPAGDAAQPSQPGKPNELSKPNATQVRPQGAPIREYGPPGQTYNPPHAQPVNPMHHLAAQMHRADMSKLPAAKTIGRQSAAEAAVRAALDEVVELGTKETTLAALAKQLGDKHEIAVVLDLAELKANEKSPETVIDPRVGKTTLRKALRAALRSDDLTFVVRNDALVITSAEAAELETFVRIYQVHDLVVAPNDPDGRPNYDSLTELIMSTILPESWREAGGTQGEIKAFDGPGVMALIVTQTEDVHEQVEALLTDLREAKVPGLAELQSRRPKPPPEQPFMSGPRGGIPQIGFPWIIQPAVQQPGNQPAGTQPPPQAQPAGTQPSGTPRQGGGYF